MEEVALGTEVVLLAGLPESVGVEGRQHGHAAEVVCDGSSTDPIVEKLLLRREDVGVQVQVAGHQH